MDGGTLPPPPAKMKGETLAPAAEMGEETRTLAALLDGEIQRPPAETEGETQQPTPLPACVSKVLDDDNLLPEIIVRVGFPTSLVRAAAVCRRWLGLASDRAFLRRFRELHPPRLLGFYLAQWWYPDDPARFFPVLPQPPHPELAGVIRRARFSLDLLYEGQQTYMVACWNGRVVTSLQVTQYNHNEARDKITFLVHSPLCSKRRMAVIPALHLPLQEANFSRYGKLFSKEEDNVVSYIYVSVLESVKEVKSMVQVFRLENGDRAWRTHLTLTVEDILYTRSQPRAVLIDNKIYMPSTRPQLAVLDLTASTFSTVQLPPGVDFHTVGTTMLSCGDDASGVCLIQAKRQQLHIWLHKGDNWLLVDKICLREMCAPLLEDEPAASLRINHEGNYTAEFLILEIGRFTFYLDVKCRTLRKVYERTRDDLEFGRIYPFMMVWPPIFRALKDGPARAM